MTRFPATYPEAAARFLELATEGGFETRTHVHPTSRGPDGGELAVHVAVPAGPQPDRVLVLVSGTHGVEGFAGSAIQCAVLSGDLGVDLDGTSLVMIHALNPHGMAHERRVNENNVDLNRNFLDHANPPDRPDYALLHGMLVPDDLDGPARQAADAALLEVAAERGPRFLQAAVTGGQWAHPDGLFYGGTRPCWSNQLFRDVVQRHVTGAERVAYIDLHTGLGRRGAAEPIFRGGLDAAAVARARAWYGEELTLSEDGTSSSTPITGNTASAVAHELGPGVELTAITLEFGTVRSLEALQALRADNWVHNRPATCEERERARGLMRAAFHPDDPAWEEAVMTQARRYLARAARGIRS